MKQWEKKDVLAVAQHPGVAVVHVPCEALATARPSPQQDRPAYVKFMMPDEWVKSIRGEEDKRPVFAIVYIPSDVRKQAESPIVTPGVVMP